MELYNLCDHPLPRRYRPGQPRIQGLLLVGIDLCPLFRLRLLDGLGGESSLCYAYTSSVLIIPDQGSIPRAGRPNDGGVWFPTTIRRLEPPLHLR